MTIDEAVTYFKEEAERRERMSQLDGSFVNETRNGQKKRIHAEAAKNNRQLAEWLTELKEAKQLLKAAVEDITGMQFGGECKVCNKKLLPNECPIHNNESCILGNGFKWRYADEALALIGDEPNGI